MGRTHKKRRFCRTCGREMIDAPRGRLYCSPECNAIKCWGAVPACQRCGRTFLPAKVKNEQPKPLYCSEECRLGRHRADAYLTIGGQVALIPLGEGLYAKVDTADLPVVAKHLWRPRLKDGNLYAQGAGSVGEMHQVLLPVPAGMTVDHRDGDGLNNRRSNLRVATPTQQQGNTKIRRHSRSGFKGVRTSRSGNRFSPYITINGRQTCLGSYGTPEEAARVYDEAARKHFGEFAATNFPRGNERPARRPN